ncbi:MAG: DUF4397 domain-containing protein [Acidimicrobiia bacterium]|nr:DUF4397 domain-containing protein [Acidimicrobiia bacterium]
MIRRLLIALLVLTTLQISSAFGAVKVSVVHGIPGATVDVYVNGGLLLPNFQFGTVTPVLPVPAGNYEVKVFAAGANPATSIPVVSLPSTALADGLNATIVAHLSAVGAPVLTPFVNDVSAIGGQGNLPPATTPSTRLAVRHTAQAPTVSVVANGRVLVTFSNGAEAAADLRTHGYAVWLALPGTKTPVFGPVNVRPEPGELLAVYAVGSIGDGTFTLLTQSFDLN